jgi:hypothetical protein
MDLRVRMSSDSTAAAAAAVTVALLGSGWPAHVGIRAIVRRRPGAAVRLVLLRRLKKTRRIQCITTHQPPAFGCSLQPTASPGTGTELVNSLDPALDTDANDDWRTGGPEARIYIGMRILCTAAR